MLDFTELLAKLVLLDANLVLLRVEIGAGVGAVTVFFTVEVEVVEEELIEAIAFLTAEGGARLELGVITELACSLATFFSLSAASLSLVAVVASSRSNLTIV